jgi:hypothetical protein
LNAQGKRHFTNFLVCEFLCLFIETNYIADLSNAPAVVLVRQKCHCLCENSFIIARIFGSVAPWLADASPALARRLV